MLSRAEFYAVRMWTLLFAAWGALYSIVEFRHIGIDIGTNRRVIDVPALLGGTVVRVIRASETLGSVVVLDVGHGLFHSYCHLSKDRLPVRGDWIGPGERVGRLAGGPSTLPMGHVDYPGSAWGGIHLHLVISTHPESAYSKVAGHRTLRAFRDPADTIREVLSAPAANKSRPFVPQTFEVVEEEVEMKIITSSIGQSLAIGSLVVQFGSPEEVEVALSKGLEIQEVHPETHKRMIAESNLRRHDRLPFVLVYGDPSGTVYTFAGDELNPVYDPSTLPVLKQGAYDTVTWSAEEIRLRLAQQEAARS
ncbi:peptidoglycan DD-metalloendopeptidase family protein [Microbacterium plantarum]|uniref:peptidoglycan DD-metalloendopeptidase family protein n=1 Tax=Microbacterium plantarum TaxID=1816425 RepID=UPI002B466C97|nr:peptidoglycan DD-metalloendopeptidase family protein [Microbacterium plantarum]WRK16491.1 peptidoglycan DD-metalloendopeptidase family protein [Microbacterium plantarum]